MRTTWKELKEMIENEGAVDNTQIVAKVRGSSTEDYSVDNSIIAYMNENGVLIIKDKLSE